MIPGCYNFFIAITEVDRTRLMNIIENVNCGIVVNERRDGEVARIMVQGMKNYKFEDSQEQFVSLRKKGKHNLRKVQLKKIMF